MIVSTIVLLGLAVLLELQQQPTVCFYSVDNYIEEELQQ